MLQAIDTLIGFVLVMLLLSTAVAFLVQAFSAVFNMRGTALLKGLKDLLRQICPALTKESAIELAEAVLRHGSIGKINPFPIWPTEKRQLAEVIKREEFIQILLTLGAQSLKGGQPSSTPLEQGLACVLETAAITTPAQAQELLDKIRTKAVEVEQKSPELASHLRMTEAILTSAQGKAKEVIATIHATFDNGMERVRDYFIANARLATLIASVILILVIPVDSLQLFRCIWVDATLRASLVEFAATVKQDEPPKPQEVPAVARQISDLLAKGSAECSGTELLPTCLSVQKDVSGQEYRHFLVTHFFGLALTITLLCLGAPFWFDLLKNLLKLRPMLAGKEDKERSSRNEGEDAAKKT